MQTNRKLKVALVKPPLPGHLFRGTGRYAFYLYESLSKLNEIEVSWVNYSDNFGKYDIIHFPYFDPFFITLPLFKTKPFLVTVHDLIPLRYPRHFPKGIRGTIKWQIQKFSMKNANGLITDSNASREDIVKFTGIKKEKIHVIKLGVSKEFKKISDTKSLTIARRKLGLPQKFILYVGDLNYNKNMEVLLKAFSLLSVRHDDYFLVMVGSAFAKKNISLFYLKNMLDSFRLNSKVRMYGRIETQDLVKIYNLSESLVVPSLFEGFGLPVLEAQSCGVPVVSSNTSALYEICSNSALMSDPKDAKGFSDNMIKLIEDKEARENLIRSGFENAKGYTWEKTAEETYMVYREMVRY